MSPSEQPTGSPSGDIWQVAQQLRFDQPLAPDDPRWGETTSGRGAFSFEPLNRSLGVDSRNAGLCRLLGSSAPLRVQQKLERWRLFSTGAQPPSATR